MCQKYHNTLFLDNIMKFEYFVLNKQLTGWLKKVFYQLFLLLVFAGALSF